MSSDRDGPVDLLGVDPSCSSWNCDFVELAVGRVEGDFKPPAPDDDEGGREVLPADPRAVWYLDSRRSVSLLRLMGVIPGMT